MEANTENTIGISKDLSGALDVMVHDIFDVMNKGIGNIAWSLLNEGDMTDKDLHDVLASTHGAGNRLHLAVHGRGRARV